MKKGKIVALVTARGGSMRLPGKNLREFAGHPLIVHTINAARLCPDIDRVLVSTDDQLIAEVARNAGGEVPFLRPDVLAGDSAASIDVVFHALDWLAEYESFTPWAVVLLQPTSPLRTASHLSDAIAQLGAQTPPAAVVSVVGARPASWLLRLDSRARLSPYLVDTKLPTLGPMERIVMPNGAIYLATLEYLRKTGGFIGPDTEAFEMAPIESIDIDTADDFALALACQEFRRGR